MSTFYQPDGPEERTAFADDTFERELEDAEIEGQLADEVERDDLVEVDA